MRPSRIIKSDAFRFAALFAAIFLAFTFILMGTVLFIVEGTQRAALNAANDADIATVANGFRDEGLPEAVEVVRQRLGTVPAARKVYPDCYMVILNEKGEKLAGNLPALPVRLGVFDITIADPSGGRTILGRGIEVAQGAYLFVGRDTMLLEATRERIVHAFAWVAAGAVVLAVLGGLYLGFRFLRRLDAIAKTCSAIIAGRFEERIPVSGREDEWDRLAGAINEMLNRIAALLENLRQMSSDVAHDLRTPMTRLRNRLEAARLDSTGVAQYAAAIDTAIEDVDRLLAMFSALLRISQVEAGARLGSFSPVPLRSIMDNIQQMYLPVAEDYRHGLESMTGADAYVHGDAELLTQMFSNLVENAIRHTPEGTHIRLLLETQRNRVVASVMDDGPGIDSAERQKVLRRFYRIPGGRDSNGHGLGLSLVAAIAELHHGTLELSSANPGLRVTLSFPGAADHRT